MEFSDFEADWEAVLTRALEAGVTRILVPGIDLGSSQKAVEIAGANEPVFAAVGVHPNQAGSWNEGTLERLKELAGEPGVAAIGEIGLDFYRDSADIGLQQEVFRLQLELASELGLPVVVHNRDATQAVLKVLSDWHSNLVEFGSELVERAGVLHSYSDSLETANEAGEIGLFIGITGPVTFKKADTLREVVSQLPMERLLVETDSPYLSPEPFRGRRNEPAHVRIVAEKIAELHGTTLESVSEQTSENARRLFLW
jgi:TatD DNase family protein